MVWLHHLFGHPHVIQAARARKVAEPELGKERLDVCKACVGAVLAVGAM